MFVLNEKGHIRYQRRLEYSPSCLMVYNLPTSGGDIYEDNMRTVGQVMTDARETKKLDTPCFMYMIGSFNSLMHIYNDVRLVWAAKTTTPPIFVKTANFED